MDQKTYTESLNQLSQRSSSCLDVVNDLLEAWSFDLDSRKPGIAYVDEQGVPVTTLDMACVLAKLVEWEPVILLAEYEGIGPATKRADQIVVSKDNRHGKIVSLVSNKDTFNFSMRVFDMNVMSAKSVGDYRTFALFFDGDWNPGFHNLQFKPTPEEEKVLKKIASGSNTIAFDTFIYPNRWPSFYGRYYRLAKHAILRLADEKKAVEAKKAVLEKLLNIEKEAYVPTEKVGETVPTTVWKFNLEFEEAETFLKGEYLLDKIPSTKEGYDQIFAYSKSLNKKLETLRFQTRATEFALFSNIKKRVGEKNLLSWTSTPCNDQGNKIPLAAWVNDKSWEVGWQVPPRKKNKKYYARMEIDSGETFLMHINTMTIQRAAK